MICPREYQRPILSAYQYAEISGLKGTQKCMLWIETSIQDITLHNCVQKSSGVCHGP